MKIELTRHHTSEYEIPVVLIPGFMEVATMWNPFLHAFKNHPVWIPEFPGHGKSPLEKQYSIPDLAESILLALQQEDVGRFWVAGHSMGGYVASEMLHQKPSSIQKMALFQSTSRPDSEEKKAYRDRAVAAVQENKNRFVRTTIQSLFTPSKKEAHSSEVEALITTACSMPTEAISAALLAMKNRHDHLNTVKSHRAKCSLFIGADDPRLNPIESVAEHQEVNFALFASAPKCGHMAHIEDPIWGESFLTMWANAQ
ncbi:MAG: hypothetical protein RL226_151 [Bacteroidota bacterium]